jgi:hypothetical protein
MRRHAKDDSGNMWVEILGFGDPRHVPVECNTMFATITEMAVFDAARAQNDDFTQLVKPRWIGLDYSYRDRIPRGINPDLTPSEYEKIGLLTSLHKSIKIGEDPFLIPDDIRLKTLGEWDVDISDYILIKRWFTTNDSVKPTDIKIYENVWEDEMEASSDKTAGRFSDFWSRIDREYAVKYINNRIANEPDLSPYKENTKAGIDRFIYNIGTIRTYEKAKFFDYPVSKELYDRIRREFIKYKRKIDILYDRMTVPGPMMNRPSVHYSIDDFADKFMASLSRKIQPVYGENGQRKKPRFDDEIHHC